MNAGGAGESAQERDNAAKCGKRSGKRYTAPIELGFEGGGPWVTMCWKRAGGSRIEAIRDIDLGYQLEILLSARPPF